MLLSEVWRWTGDAAIVKELEPAARAALAWIDDYGDRDGDGFVEYERRAPHGLENQSWKDSGDSQRFRDGRLASTPIAPAEVQGYAYDARLRAAELADHVWDDPELADQAAGERRRAPRPIRRGVLGRGPADTYALALDGDKQRVDSLCSNLGHLLWSGIVPTDRVGQVAAALAGPELWTGWGVRTMGAAEAAYNPLSYHNGTVWPHDTALAAWGLERAGQAELAQLFSLSLIEAAASLDYSLARGVRRLRAREDGVPGRLSNRRQAPGVGGRSARALPHAAPRPAPGPDRRRPREHDVPRRPTGSREHGSRASERSAASGRWRLGTGPSW